MATLKYEILQSFRDHSFRTGAGLCIRNKIDAIRFVDERGYIFFWPITGITFPSLWVSVTGDRPVASAHDDPGHITWRWKDDLLGKGIWYYAKIIRKKSTLVSMDIVPYFYALSENYGSPEHDYLTLYEQGLMTHEAKVIYEAILTGGPLDTITIRQISHMNTRASAGNFDRAINTLQSDFKILPVGIAQTGGWRYAFIYDIVARHYPEIQDQAQQIPEDEARLKLIELYFSSVGAAQVGEIRKFFGWKKPLIERALQKLLTTGFLIPGIKIEQQPGEWFIFRDLMP